MERPPIPTPPPPPHARPRTHEPPRKRADADDRQWIQRLRRLRSLEKLLFRVRVERGALAKGAFAGVLRASFEGRPIAIKVSSTRHASEYNIHRDVLNPTGDPIFPYMFYGFQQVLSRAQAQALLQHASGVPSDEVELCGAPKRSDRPSRFWILVFECAASDLRSLLNAGRLMFPRRWVARLLYAVARTARLGLTHNDGYFRNILVRRDSTLALADWGFGTSVPGRGRIRAIKRSSSPCKFVWPPLLTVGKQESVWKRPEIPPVARDLVSLCISLVRYARRKHLSWRGAVEDTKALLARVEHWLEEFPYPALRLTDAQTPVAPGFRNWGMTREHVADFIEHVLMPVWADV